MDARKRKPIKVKKRDSSREKLGILIFQAKKDDKSARKIGLSLHLFKQWKTPV